MKFIANYEWKRTWLVFNKVFIKKAQDKGIFDENFKSFPFQIKAKQEDLRLLLLFMTMVEIQASVVRRRKDK